MKDVYLSDPQHVYPVLCNTQEIGGGGGGGGLSPLIGGNR